MQIQKDKYNEEPYLIILPCNSGARFGNYFQSNNYSNNWMKAYNVIKHKRNEFFFCAISEVNFHFNDNNGALVFENEMNRVKSDNDMGDVHLSHFDISGNIKHKFKIQTFIDNIIIGIERTKQLNIHKYLVFLTPFTYKVAFHKAIKETNIIEKVYSFDIATMGGISYYLKFIPLIYHDYLSPGIYNYDYLNYRSPLPKNIKLTDDLNYFSFENYKKISEKNIVNAVIKKDKKYFNIPILKEHINLFKQNTNAFNEIYFLDNTCEVIEINETDNKLMRSPNKLKNINNNIYF